MKVTFTIPGEPKGKGRPRFTRTGSFVKTYTPIETASYENLVRVEYERQCQKRFPDDAMLDMRILAYFSIPKSAGKKKRLKMLDNLIRPTKKPDMDNIMKVIADSLNHIAYKDDTQIVDAQVRKFYSEEPRVVVVIREVSNV